MTSEIHDTGSGVLSAGFATLVRGNTVTGTTSMGIYLAGDASQAVTNRVSTGLHGILAAGGGMVVAYNDVRYMTGQGLAVSGSAPTVQRNQVLGAGMVGITVACVDCFGGSASWNTVTDSVSDGLSITSDGPGLVVSNNTLLRTGQGLTLNGIGIRARANRVTDPGAAAWAPCYEIYGDGNTLITNTATACSSSGFYVNGNDNLLDRNVATATFESGFKVDGDSGGTPYAGNILTANRTLNDIAYGFVIVNGASATRLTGNKTTSNCVDLCDAGSGTTGTGNNFDSIAGICTIQH